MNTMPPPRVDAVLAQAVERIGREDAVALLLHVLERTAGWLYAHGDEALPSAQAEAFAALVARRSDGEPVAYLTGRRGFWSLDLAVTPQTLIPRPETGLLVELALARLPAGSALRVADLGTGSGAIALALARERPRAQVVATDRSTGALAVARANAASHAITNVTFREGDWCAPLAGDTFDLIASNPPYIGERDPHLDQGDLRFEPSPALASGGDGLDAIRVIAASAPACLRTGGWLLVEHGYQQGAAVRALLVEAGFAEVSTALDLEDRERVTSGRRLP